jgi:sulfatase maturation enzyme AslB (radical SAM superfamily)
VWVEVAHLEGIISAWGRILTGYIPALSIEITRECPLRCPGCYAYGDDHLGGDVTLREVRDLKGQALVDGIIELVDRQRPLHVSLVGGEPLVRYRELNVLLPMLAERGIHVQLVTSAVREIPLEWRGLRRLSIVVSIDGLQPERRATTPATYDRILKHIAGHEITVHCTVTRQQVNRPGYLDEFLRFWSARKETGKIWMSLYTPQIGESSAERLTASDRRHVVSDLMALRVRYPKLAAPKGLLEVYRTAAVA